MWDSADIESWLSRFVQVELVYDVHYVKVEGADVLLLEIEPPRAGDPIYCLQASTGNEEFSLTEGTIYVRRSGKTAAADASEVASLTKRAKSASTDAGLRLEVAVTSQELSVLEPEALGASVRDSWIERERRRLMKPVPTASILPISPGELRSVAEFEKQVESYLAEVAADWPRFALSRHVLHNEPSLTLAVENLTDENFENVVIELSVPLLAENIETSSALVAEAVTSVQSLTEWGEYPLTKIDRSIFGHAPSTEVSTSGEAAIVRFPPMHVYPQSTSALETLILALEPEWAASEMSIEWRATASNTRGAIAGSVSIPVSDVPDPSTTCPLRGRGCVPVGNRSTGV